MTKPKALRNYFKAVYDVDLDQMTTVSVLKQFFKQKYDVDVEGSTVSEVLLAAIEKGIKGGSGAMVLNAAIEVDEGVTLLRLDKTGKEIYDHISNGGTACIKYGSTQEGAHAELIMQIVYAQISVTDDTAYTFYAYSGNESQSYMQFEAYESLNNKCPYCAIGEG